MLSLTPAPARLSPDPTMPVIHQIGERRLAVWSRLPGACFAASAGALALAFGLVALALARHAATLGPPPEVHWLSTSVCHEKDWTHLLCLPVMLMNFLISPVLVADWLGDYVPWWLQNAAPYAAGAVSLACLASCTILLAIEASAALRSSRRSRSRQ